MGGVGGEVVAAVVAAVVAEVVAEVVAAVVMGRPSTARALRMGLICSFETWRHSGVLL